jgi:hypothetical protein
VYLRLAFEKSFVASLSKTRCGVHNEFGIRHKWNAAVAGQIKIIRRRPLDLRVIGTDLQMNQIMFAFVMSGHCRERFPIHAFFVNAQSAPCGFVLKNLMEKLIDAGTRFARAGVAGNEPAATELISPPCEAPKPGNLRFMSARNQ